MSSGAQKKIGGDYGEIRAPIDTQKLNAYLDKYAPIVKTPVDIKQFKVSHKKTRARIVSSTDIKTVWSGMMYYFVP